MMSWREETLLMPWSYSKTELGRRYQKVQFARRQENITSQEAERSSNQSPRVSFRAGSRYRGSRPKAPHQSRSSTE